MIWIAVCCCVTFGMLDVDFRLVGLLWVWVFLIGCFVICFMVGFWLVYWLEFALGLDLGVSWLLTVSFVIW